MLSVFYGDMEEAIYAPGRYFDQNYTDEWIVDDLSRKMIKDIDKSEVIAPQTIWSPLWGNYPPTRIARGTKTLIAANMRPDIIFCATTHCGDNCAKWFLQIGRQKDITINLIHFMNFGKRPFTIRIANNDKSVHTEEELFDNAIDFL